MLISYLDALHNDRVSDGLSLYECIQEYEELDKVTPLNVPLTGILTSFQKDKLDFSKKNYILISLL